MTAERRRAAVRELVLAAEPFAAEQASAALPLGRAVRARIGGLIEVLIALLDQAAGDPDMEDGDLDRCLAAEDGPPIAPALDRLWRDAA